MTARIGVLARRAAIAALLLSLTGGCAFHNGHTSSTDALSGYQSDVGEVQVISAVVGGKNVFIPSTIVVTSGRPQALSVFNTTDKPHGFAIKGLSIETVLYAGKETRIELPALEAHEIYTIGCQLHPPHRTGTLVVAPGR
jgi:hypothetical protein